MSLWTTWKNRVEDALLSRDKKLIVGEIAVRGEEIGHAVVQQIVFRVVHPIFRHGLFEIAKADKPVYRDLSLVLFVQVKRLKTGLQQLSRFEIIQKLSPAL